MNEQTPLPWVVAAAAEVRCIGASVHLLASRRVHLPSELVGIRVNFADGTRARVYRETVVEGVVAEEPCTLVVEFRLRLVRGWAHTVFRCESLLNTPLFVGFPGYVSKLWLAHDQRNVYRGIYEWDGAERAERYARSLWRVLQLGCLPTSIHYIVLPGLRRDELLTAPPVIAATGDQAGATWWRPVAVE
jgi:hypothetical protein